MHSLFKKKAGIWYFSFKILNDNKDELPDQRRFSNKFKFEVEQSAWELKLF